MNDISLYYIPPLEKQKLKIENHTIIDNTSRFNLHHSIESCLLSYLLGIEKLNNSIKINNNRQLKNESKLQLYNTINSLKHYITSTAQTKIKKLFWRNLRLIIDNNNNNNNNNHQEILKEIILYLCEKRSNDIVDFLIRYIYDRDYKDLIKFFLDKDKNIQLWFEHFHYDGRNKYGANSLERFMFAKREDVWDRIVWLKKPIPPPVLAQKREMMLQINVIETIKSILELDDYWSKCFIQKYIIGDLSSNSSNNNNSNNSLTELFLSIDYQYFVDIIYRLLLESTDNNLMDSFDRILSNMFGSYDSKSVEIPFSIFRLLNDDDLLIFCDGLVDFKSIYKEKQQSTLESNVNNLDNTENLLNSIIISTCKWDSIDHLLLYNSISISNIKFIFKPLFTNNDEELTDEQIEFKTNINNQINQYFNSIKSKDDLNKDILIKSFNDFRNSNNIKSLEMKKTIKYLLIESFIYYFILNNTINQKQQQPVISNQQIELILNENRIEYRKSSINKEDKKDHVNLYTILSDSSDDDDLNEMNNHKKRKKKKKKSKSNIKKSRFSNINNSDEDDIFPYQDSKSTKIINWIIPIISNQIEFTNQEVIYLIYKLTIDLNLYFCLNPK